MTDSHSQCASVALFNVRRNGVEIDLVDDNDAFNCRRQIAQPREIGVRMLRVGNQYHHIGTLALAMCTAYAFALHRIMRFAQACGVGQFQRDAIETDAFAQYVARGAGDIGDDGAIAACKCIEQAGLARVGATDNRYAQTVIESHAALGLAQQVVEFGAQGRQLLRYRGVGEKIDFFFGKIDRRFDVYAQCNQGLQQGLDLA